MKLKIFFLTILGKFIVKISQWLKLGSGSTWPGHLALILNKNFIKEILNNNPDLKIILITGTNGKTTTVSLLKFLLKKKGYRVLINDEGANLINGMASTLIKNISLTGRLNANIAVFESDEFAFPLFIDQMRPAAIIVLNLFRDQLDRYGEVNSITIRWYKALKKLSRQTAIFINGDDPNLFHLGSRLVKNNFRKIFFFGINENLMEIKDLPHDVDFNFCPNCLKPLIYKKISYSHLGDYQCSFCNFRRQNINDFFQKKINYPLAGLFMLYNTNAVLLLLTKIFGFKIDELNRYLTDFQPKFGRQEKFIYQRKQIYIFLAKNPVSYNQTLDAIKKIVKDKKANFLLVLNDRIPDGRDVSWIWDVDFNHLFPMTKKIFVSGDRAFDLAIRLKYDDFNNFNVFSSLKEAVNQAINDTGLSDKLIIIPNYSAMLEIRKLIVGKKFS
jgi:UDP-N-acetylmuramyl tripeptide synthase